MKVRFLFGSVMSHKYYRIPVIATAQPEAIQRIQDSGLLPLAPSQ
jgi:hypothetical protein